MRPDFEKEKTPATVSSEPPPSAMPAPGVVEAASASSPQPEKAFDKVIDTPTGAVEVTADVRPKREKADNAFRRARKEDVEKFVSTHGISAMPTKKKRITVVPDTLIEKDVSGGAV
jgi:hypothetical protein